MQHLQLLVAAVMATVAVTSAAPWFCRDYDCPSFTTTVDKGAYEIRDYNETKWVVTSVKSYKPDPSRRQANYLFSRLYHYLGGDNNKREKMDMTVPVLTKTKKQGRVYTITMMFYLSETNPPAPTKHGVYLVTRPAGSVFVRSFPTWWWPSNSVFRDQLYDMKKAIGDSQYNNAAYYKAGYNSPYDFFQKKQHEVWMDMKSSTI